MSKNAQWVLAGILAVVLIFFLRAATNPPAATVQVETDAALDEGPRMVPRSERSEEFMAEMIRRAEQREADRKRREEANKPNLELLEASATSSEYSTTVTGKIRNNSSKTYQYAQVRFQMYDSNGNRVGSALGNITGLEPGQIWRFKALYAGENGDRYRLDEITGF